jgi:hypothetical protein
MLAVAAVTGALLSGCGGGGGSSQASPSAYVKSVCSSVGGWLASVKARGAQLNTIKTASPAQGRQELQGFFAGVIADTDKALAAIKAAGVPKVSNGQQVASAFQNVFTQFKTVMTQSEAQVNQLPTNSPTAFKAAADRIAATIRQSLSGLASGLSALRTPELQKAAAQTPACQSL